MVNKSVVQELNPKILKFTDTIKIPKMFLVSVGLDPFPTNQPPHQRTVTTNLFFEIGLWNLRTCEISYVIYLYKAIKTSFLLMDAGISLPCLICCMLSEFKVTLLRRNRKEFDKIMRFLDENFPKNREEQDYFGIMEVHRATKRLSMVLAIGFSMFCWSFNLFPLLEGTISSKVYGRNFTYPLPYNMWHPFRTDRIGAYIGVNIYLTFAAFAVTHYYIGADSILFTIANQISMHFKYISKRITDYKPRGLRRDFEFLMGAVQYHDEVLKVCDSINAVFSNSMLLNFMGSGGIICLVAFRATLSDFSADLVKFMFYFIAMIIQIFILCSFGDKLIQSSTEISQAVFEHDWFDGDKSYKQAMVLIMQRAQKPAVLTASYFSIVSYRSFKEVMTSSYQFFAVLHSMYA